MQEAMDVETYSPHTKPHVLIYRRAARRSNQTQSGNDGRLVVKTENGFAKENSGRSNGLTQVKNRFE